MDPNLDASEEERVTQIVIDSDRNLDNVTKLVFLSFPACLKLLLFCLCWQIGKEFWKNIGEDWTEASLSMNGQPVFQEVLTAKCPLGYKAYDDLFCGKFSRAQHAAYITNVIT